MQQKKAFLYFSSDNSFEQLSHLFALISDELRVNITHSHTQITFVNNVHHAVGL